MTNTTTGLSGRDPDPVSGPASGTTQDPPPALPAERRARVVELLRRHGVVRVNDLAAELDVSAITIRRDINLLAEKGVIRRVRGGAVLQNGPLGEGVPGVGAAPVVPTRMPIARAERQVTIGMVVPSLDYYWPDVIRGVRAASGAGARIVLRGATYQA
ncbi:MAG TPA: DeoR family transcriptional regulator, partial [Thermopolyspora sp.]